MVIVSNDGALTIVMMVILRVSNGDTEDSYRGALIIIMM